MFTRLKQILAESKTLLTFSLFRCIGQFLGMIVPLLVAKFFSPETFGSFTLARMIIFLLIALFIEASQTPFIVHATQERKQTGKINKSFSIQCLFWAVSLCLFIILTGIFKSYVIRFANITEADLIPMQLAFTGLSLTAILNTLFLATGKRVISALIDLAYGAACCIILLIFYMTNRVSLHSVFWVYFLSSILILIIFLPAAEFKLFFPLRFDRHLFAEMLNFTKWVALGAVAVYLVNWGDNFILRYFVSMEQLGIYNFSLQFFKGIAILTSTVGQYFLPFVSQNINNADKTRDYLYHKKTKILIVGIPAIIIVLFFVIPFFINLVYGQQYPGSILIVRIIVIAAVMNLPVVLYGPVFNAMKEYRFAQTINILHACGNFILNILLIPAFGITGAAITCALSYTIRTIIFEWYFHHKLKPSLLTQA